MGCNMSIGGVTKMNRQAVVHSIKRELNLTDEQKQLIKDSWELFEPKKMAIGRKMFVK